MASARARGMSRRSERSRTRTVAAASQKATTKDVLIDVAEQLFSRLGIDAVSLREIATAAGQANSNVVQYHFQDKEGLVRAILLERANRIDAMRLTRLQALTASGKADAHE